MVQLSSVLPYVKPAFFSEISQACNAVKTYDPKDSKSVEDAQDAVVPFFQTAVRASAAALAYLAYNKIHALGFAQAAYAFGAVGATASVPAALMLGSVLLLTAAYSRTVAVFVAKRALSCLATQCAAKGFAYAAAVLALVNEKTMSFAYGPVSPQGYHNLNDIKGLNWAESTFKTVAEGFATMVIRKASVEKPAGSDPDASAAAGTPDASKK